MFFKFTRKTEEHFFFTCWMSIRQCHKKYGLERLGKKSAEARGWIWQGSRKYIKREEESWRVEGRKIEGAHDLQRNYEIDKGFL